MRATGRARKLTVPGATTGAAELVDSVRHGADDNATMRAALLAVGRAFAHAPGRRQALFVWHGAEKRGLLGSRWYAAHATVPRAAIAAVLDADMIRRDAPDSAAPLGAQPPHRNSRDLVALALTAQRARLALRARHRVGPADAPRGMVLPQRRPALRARRRAGWDSGWSADGCLA